jgi:site-specific DNA-methyltransferase (adenine-specific)
VIELNKIINADCMDIMKIIPDKYFELAIVDPPYGIKADKGFGGFGKPIARKQYTSKWDDAIPQLKYFDELFRVSKNQIIFGGNFFSHLLPQNNHWIMWDKKNTMPTFSDGELIYTSFNRNSVKIFEVEYNGLLGKENIKRFHPCQKPIKIYKKLLSEYAKEGDKIIDTHSGSCPLAIACIDMGFEYLCIEKDKEYFEKSVERVNKELIKIKMF